MTAEQVQQAAIGAMTPSVDLSTQIGTMANRLDEIAGEMGKAKDEDTARYQTLKEEQVALAASLTDVKARHDATVRDEEVKAAIETAAEWKARLGDVRSPSKAGQIGTGPQKAASFKDYDKGAFLFGVFQANSRDGDKQREGKAILSALAGRQFASTDVATDEGKAVLDSIRSWNGPGDGKGFLHEEAWGKSTLGTTDATGGWVIPNAIVDEFITPATVDNIYRTICTVVPGVTAAGVDIPFRSAARTRAAIAAFGATKDNADLAYNGYTATMYTLARIYDIGNQFLRQSRGAAEQDVLSELAAAFAQGEAWYVREGTGSSQPFGYTPALTNGPAAFRSAFTASATTLAGSMSNAIATAAGALAGRGVGGRAGQGLGAVLSATSYWTMLAQGTDTAGFFFNPSQGPTAINAPAGTLISPFGIPVYPDADMDLEGTAAVIDNLVVGNWKKFKLYFGQDYRVDSSDQAGTRWDTNLTGFRGEEEMGFDARPAVYAGHFQMVTDITP